MNIKKLMKNKKGFTLIEIIVVVVILAVLMAVAVPSVLNYINEADDAKYMAQAHSVYSSAQAEFVKELVTSNGMTAAELPTVTGRVIKNCGVNGVMEVTLYSVAPKVGADGKIDPSNAGTAITGPVTTTSPAADKELVAIVCNIGGTKAAGATTVSGGKNILVDANNKVTVLK